MSRMVFAAAAAALSLSVAPAAFAASDYRLELGGVDGAAPTKFEIQSWSWGATNSGSVAAAAGRPRARVAVGDLDGDGAAELASAPEIQGFTLSFDKTSPQLMLRCAKGKHIAQAVLTTRRETFELIDATVTECTDNSRAGAGRNSMPNRISMNVTTPRQSQGATFGERCLASSCAAPPQVRMTITGQLKHTRTGHVTLMK